MAAIPEDLALAAALALQDIEEIEARRKGKAYDGRPLTDEELAFQLFTEEANSLLAFAQDAAYAASIDKALDTDRAILRMYAASEARETRDRDMAFALSGQSRVASPEYATPDVDRNPVSLLTLLDNLSICAE